jgi:RNA polymerase sigma factor (sigma-70 family)
VSKLNDFWNNNYSGLRVYSMALHQCGEDLLQEIYLRLHDHEEFTRIVEEGENPVGYVMRCLRGEVNSVTSRFYYKYRKDRTRAAAEHLQFLHEDAHDEQREELLTDLEDCLRGLDVCERTVLDLLYKHGASMKSITEETGISYRDIKQLRDNGKEEIRKGLGRHYRKGDQGHGY